MQQTNNEENELTQLLVGGLGKTFLVILQYKLIDKPLPYDHPKTQGNAVLKGVHLLGNTKGKDSKKVFRKTAGLSSAGWLLTRIVCRQQGLSSAWFFNSGVYNQHGL